MKKKRILGIVTAMLMVIALALTGCGQQGEQNAGATGSEGQNSTITDNGNENNGEATAEPEEPDTTMNGIDNRHPEMRDGYYVYEVLGEEFLCKTNVWDYIDEDAKIEIARRSRGTPRIANRLLKRVRDFAQVIGEGKITFALADKALGLMEVDKLGLDGVDRRILETMIDKFGGGPVGLETLAAATGEEATTIEDVYEPYLIQLGYISRTPRGRIVLAPAYEHLGKVMPE